MEPEPFRLKPVGELNAEDFEQSLLWAGYYEPDDVEEISRWGIAPEVVRAALDAVDWQDDHYFPLPIQAAQTAWMRGKLYGSAAITPDGTRLPAYVGETHDYVVVFLNGRRFLLSEDTPGEEAGLKKMLSARELVPLKIENRVTGECWTYPED